jgi:hypothetical protein
MLMMVKKGRRNANAPRQQEDETQYKKHLKGNGQKRLKFEVIPYRNISYSKFWINGASWLKI